MITMIICAAGKCGARLEFARDSDTGTYSVRSRGSVAKLAKPPHTLLYASSSAFVLQCVRECTHCVHSFGAVGFVSPCQACTVCRARATDQTML